MKASAILLQRVQFKQFACTELHGLATQAICRICVGLLLWLSNERTWLYSAIEFLLLLLFWLQSTQVYAQCRRHYPVRQWWIEPVLRILQRIRTTPDWKTQVAEAGREATRWRWGCWRHNYAQVYKQQFNWIYCFDGSQVCEWEWSNLTHLSSSQPTCQCEVWTYLYRPTNIFPARMLTRYTFNWIIMIYSIWF